MVKIIIENPEKINEIKDLMKADMHSHTTASDGRNTVEELVERARKLDIMISVTDHNEVISSLKACKAGVGIPGIEVTSSEAIDFLVYFYKAKDLEEYYKKYIANYHYRNRGFNLRRLKWNTEELIEKSKEYNAITVLAHPFTMRPKISYNYCRKNPRIFN